MGGDMRYLENQDVPASANERRPRVPLAVLESLLPCRDLGTWSWQPSLTLLSSLAGRVRLLHHLVLRGDVRRLRVPRLGGGHGPLHLLLLHDLGPRLLHLLPRHRPGHHQVHKYRQRNHPVEEMLMRF